jgi:hypothetical protein
MRKFQKRQLLDIISSLHTVHQKSRNGLERKEYGNVRAALLDCQEAGVQLGEIIGKIEGEGTEASSYLKEYCESICQYSVELENISPQKFYKNLEQILVKAENAIRHMSVRREVVFLPYKASMWDSLESVWKAADDDPNCDAYVVPIPYYDKNQDGSLGKLHYEGDSYPEYVRITGYDEYNFEESHPDRIYIHNPYDDCNYVTSVHPFFYSENLKQYTDMLVYVPYFVFPGKPAEHLISVPGVMRADLIFVQNESVRQAYINVIKKYTEERESEIAKRIFSVGSPKIDKIVRYSRETPEMPHDWVHKLQNRKVIFFNTNVSLILHNSDRFVDNMRRIFDIFKKHRGDFAVIWREHPLSESTIQAMLPQMAQDYIGLKEEFVKEQLGIIDGNTEPYPAMCVSDCYFGSGGSLALVYSVLGKPLMITDYSYPDGISENMVSFDQLTASMGTRIYYSERNVNSFELFLEELSSLKDIQKERMALTAEIAGCMDGTAGETIYEIADKL